MTPTDKERHGSLAPVSRDTELMGIGTRRGVCDSDQIPNPIIMIQPQDVHLQSLTGRMAVTVMRTLATAAYLRLREFQLLARTKVCKSEVRV